MEAVEKASARHITCFMVGRRAMGKIPVFERRAQAHVRPYCSMSETVTDEPKSEADRQRIDNSEGKQRGKGTLP